MKLLKGLGIVLGLFVAVLVVFGLTESDENKFKYEAQRMVEKQVGGDADVNSIVTYKAADGEITACGEVSRRVDLMPGMSGPIASPFYVSKSGMVLIGVGDMMSVVYGAQANNCHLKSGTMPPKQ